MEENVVSVALYSLCENAIVYGMTYAEFWNNGLDVFFAYLKAYEQKRLTVARDMETQALWNGYYFQNALLTSPIITLQTDKLSDTKFKKIVEKYPKKTNWQLNYEKEQAEIDKVEKPIIKKASDDAIANHAKKLAQLKLRATLRQ